MDLIHETTFRNTYKIFVYRLNNRQYVNDYLFDIYDYSTNKFGTYESTRDGWVRNISGEEIAYFTDLETYLLGMLKGLRIANPVQG